MLFDAFSRNGVLQADMIRRKSFWETVGLYKTSEVISADAHAAVHGNTLANRTASLSTAAKQRRTLMNSTQLNSIPYIRTMLVVVTVQLSATGSTPASRLRRRLTDGDIQRRCRSKKLGEARSCNFPTEILIFDSKIGIEK